MLPDTISLLHAYANRLLQISKELQLVTDFLCMGPSSRGGVADYRDLEVRLSEAMRRLSRSVHAFLEDIGETWKDRLLPRPLIVSLVRLDESLQSFEAIDHRGIGFRGATVVVDAQECLMDLRRFNGKKVRRELLRTLVKDCEVVVSIGRALDAVHCLSEIRDLELQTRTIMDWLSSDLSSEPMTLINLSEIVDAACASQRRFALERGIEIRWQQHPSDIVVRGRRRDLVRVLSNIINNAVKYSYQMRNSNAWISISLQTSHDYVRVTVESWGVPIPRDEIEEGIIFRLGVRGSLAGRSGFGGHGIGLADAKRVADSHDGYLFVSSRPSDHSDLEPDYSKPFITEVVLQLPSPER